MDRRLLLSRISELLREVYGDRMKAVVLYGSEARDAGRPDSDINLLVLLDRVIDYGDDLRRNLDALYPLALELGRRISASPTSSTFQGAVLKNRWNPRCSRLPTTPAARITPVTVCFEMHRIQPVIRVTKRYDPFEGRLTEVIRTYFLYYLNRGTHGDIC